MLGHSRGGNQTAWYAAEQADPVVSKVILVAPATWSQDYAARDYKKRYGAELRPLLQRAKALVAAGKGAEMLQHTGFIYCKEATVSAEAFVSYYQNDPRKDTVYLLPKIRQPVLLFIGSEDTVVPHLAEAIETLQPKPDNLRVVVIDGADHFFRDLYAEDLVEQAVEFIQDSSRETK